MEKQLVPGVYEHYKGKKYLVLGTALNTETEELVVVYVALYEVQGIRTFIRPLAMFTETILVDGKEVLRFRYVGKVSESGMVDDSSQLVRLFQAV